MIRRTVLACCAGVLLGSAASAQGGASSPASAVKGDDLPSRRPEETQADPLRAFDINKDGRLDLAEAKSAAAAHFDELNPDRDDSLEVGEAAPVMSADEFRRYNTNHDGRITKRQYLDIVELRFNEARPPGSEELGRGDLETDRGKALLRLLR